MKKQEVQEAIAVRFELKGIPIAQCFKEPISAIIHKETRNWLGFIKVDLLNPHKDGIALLKGDRLFALQLQNSKYVIAKIEKGFEFNSTAANHSLQIQNPILNQFRSRDLLDEFTKLGFLSSTNLELIRVSKKMQ